MQNGRTRAITTRYNGYAFRSRLEARWAKFFDHLGVKWDYEPEGFELGNGLRYLPDFWLPDWGMWVEVKPSAIDAVTREKAIRLLQHTGQPIYCTEGMPDRNGVLFYQDGFGETAEIPAYAYFQKSSFSPNWRVILGFGEVHAEHRCANFALHSAPFKQEVADKGVTLREGPFQDALFSARSARFEFGEKGGAA